MYLIVFVLRGWVLYNKERKVKLVIMRKYRECLLLEFVKDIYKLFVKIGII